MLEPKIEDIISVSYHEPEIANVNRTLKCLQKIGALIDLLSKEASYIDDADARSSMGDIASDLNYEYNTLATDVEEALSDLVTMDMIVDEWRNEISSRLCSDEIEELNQLKMIYKLKKEPK